jgi:hypothetical protein
VPSSIFSPLSSIGGCSQLSPESVGRRNSTRPSHDAQNRFLRLWPASSSSHYRAVASGEQRFGELDVFGHANLLVDGIASARRSRARSASSAVSRSSSMQAYQRRASACSLRWGSSWASCRAAAKCSSRGPAPRGGCRDPGVGLIKSPGAEGDRASRFDRAEHEGIELSGSFPLTEDDEAFDGREQHRPGFLARGAGRRPAGISKEPSRSPGWWRMGVGDLCEVEPACRRSSCVACRRRAMLGRSPRCRERKRPGRRHSGGRIRSL